MNKKELSIQARMFIRDEIEYILILGNEYQVFNDTVHGKYVLLGTRRSYLDGVK
jgi:hypothetical protein